MLAKIAIEVINKLILSAISLRICMLIQPFLLKFDMLGYFSP